MLLPQSTQLQAANLTSPVPRRDSGGKEIHVILPVGEDAFD